MTASNVVTALTVDHPGIATHFLWLLRCQVIVSLISWKIQVDHLPWQLGAVEADGEELQVFSRQPNQSGSWAITACAEVSRKCDKNEGPCLVASHVPTLSWVRSRVCLRVGLRASVREGVGRDVAINRLDPKSTTYSTPFPDHILYQLHADHRPPLQTTYWPDQLVHSHKIHSLRDCRRTEEPKMEIVKTEGVGVVPPPETNMKKSKAPPFTSDPDWQHNNTHSQTAYIDQCIYIPCIRWIGISYTVIIIKLKFGEYQMHIVSLAYYAKCVQYGHISY